MFIPFRLCTWGVSITCSEPRADAGNFYMKLKSCPYTAHCSEEQYPHSPQISHLRWKNLYPLAEPNFPIYLPMTFHCSLQHHILQYGYTLIWPSDQTHIFLSQPLCSHIPARKQWPGISSLGCTCPSCVPPPAQQKSDVLSLLTPLSATGLRMCKEEALWLLFIHRSHERRDC